jgi:hypothetical protein
VCTGGGDRPDDGRLTRVHRDYYVEFTPDGLDHRDNPMKFFFDGNRRSTGTGGLAADIDDGSALREHATRVSQGRPERLENAPHPRRSRE